jgi:hypothetical protein
MRKKIALLAGSAVFTVFCVLIWRTIIFESEFDKTEDFFRETAGFQARLESALNGDTEARMRYYRIPDEYHLDGAYSEDYQEGLDAICNKFGMAIVKREIFGKYNNWFISNIEKSSSK